MSSINTLQAAIVADCTALAQAEIYAGQFSAMDLQRVLIKTPSILVDFAGAEVQDNTGTGEIDLICQFGAYCLSRRANNLHARNSSSHDLAQAVAVRIAQNRFGLPKVQPPVKIRLKPLNQITFMDNALGVVAVTWEQALRVGQSVWVGGQTPTEVWLGLSPEIGAAHINQYEQLNV